MRARGGLQSHCSFDVLVEHASAPDYDDKKASKMPSGMITSMSSSLFAFPQALTMPSRMKSLLDIFIQSP